MSYNCLTETYLEELEPVLTFILIVLKIGHQLKKNTSDKVNILDLEYSNQYIS